MKIFLEINIPDEFDLSEATEVIHNVVDIGDLEDTAIQVLRDQRQERES